MLKLNFNIVAAEHFASIAPAYRFHVAKVIEALCRSDGKTPRSNLVQPASRGLPAIHAIKIFHPVNDELIAELNFSIAHSKGELRVIKCQTGWSTTTRKQPP